MIQEIVHACLGLLHLAAAGQSQAELRMHCGEDKDLHRQLGQVSPQVVATAPDKGHDGLTPTCTTQKAGVRGVTQGKLRVLNLSTEGPTWQAVAATLGQKPWRLHSNVHGAEV